MLEKIDEERLEFVRFWAKIVRETDPSYWSHQQKTLIDSVLKSASQDRGLYLRVKVIARKIHQVLRKRRTARSENKNSGRP
mgnify:FL=1